MCITFIHLLLLTLISGVTIGFNQTTNMPSVSEGAGSVIMTVSVLNGMLARRVSVFISYAGESQFLCQICFKVIKTTSDTHVCNINIAAEIFQYIILPNSTYMQWVLKVALEYL